MTLRPIILAGLATLALSTAAFAGNTSTTTLNGFGAQEDTTQIGDDNSSTTLHRTRRQRSAQAPQRMPTMNAVDMQAVLEDMKNQIADGPFRRYLEMYLLSH
jgi:hypothetical protein